jgi:soluble lytic murein transglycosylase-like protein
VATAQRRPGAAPPRGRPGRRLLIGGLLLLLIVGVVAAERPQPLRAPVPQVLTPPPAGDPFAYRPADAGQFAARAIAGEAHALFVASPGGAVATAARVARLRPLVNAAVAGTGIDPDLLEGLVYVESAGRPDAMGSSGPAGAAGLTQILPATATSMLSLHVDLGASTSLSTQIAAAQASGATAGLAGLELRRQQVDERFDPAKALAATVRYLTTAETRFGRWDLAFVSYHMGIGNLSSVLDAYDGGQPVPYVQLYFDTAPDAHPAAYALMAGFSDQSPLYYWRVLGAAAIMHLWRTDRLALQRLNALQTEGDSSAEVLHPPGSTTQFADPAALESAYAQHQLVALPVNSSQLGLSFAPSVDAPAAPEHVPAGLYSGLRPQAMAMLLELAARVRALGHGEAPLTVTSAVLDQRAQRQLGIDDPPAAGGWSFTIARSYVGNAQRAAFQAMLDRLQALNLIAWSAYPSEIEITVASDAVQIIDHGV